jgi:hypothetical protein
MAQMVRDGASKPLAMSETGRGTPNVPKTTIVRIYVGQVHSFVGLPSILGRKYRLSHKRVYLSHINAYNGGPLGPFSGELA